MMRLRLQANGFCFEYPAGLFLIFIAVLLFQPDRGIAQLTQPARFELVHEEGDQAFTIVSLKENGMSLIRQLQKSEGSKRRWEIILLDSTLKQIWNNQILLDSRLTLIGYEYAANELYFLFRQSESNQSDLHLIRIYLFTHTVQE